jgi:hypothetical protein
MESVSYLNPAELRSSPAFSQAVRIPAGHDLIVVGGQNGVDSSGRVISDDLAGQTRQAFRNLRSASRRRRPTLIMLGGGQSWSRTEHLCRKASPPSSRSGGSDPTRLLCPSLWSAASQFQAYCARSRR